MSGALSSKWQGVRCDDALGWPEGGAALVCLCDGSPRKTVIFLRDRAPWPCVFAGREVRGAGPEWLRRAVPRLPTFPAGSRWLTAVIRKPCKDFLSD